MVQSELTGGFNARDRSSVRPAFEATVLHVSSNTMACHSLQSAGCPECVGPGAVGDVVVVVVVVVSLVVVGAVLLLPEDSTPIQ